MTQFVHKELGGYWIFTYFKRSNGQNDMHMKWYSGSAYAESMAREKEMSKVTFEGGK